MDILESLFVLQLVEPWYRSDAVEEAARQACVTEITDRFPEGLDSFSTRRRRASTRRAKQLVPQSLQSLRQGRTTFAIAHRLSTLQRADTILVIEEGE